MLLIKYIIKICPNINFSLSQAFNIGKGVVAGASLMGIGALAFYGMGLSNEAGAIDRTA